jgi:hypothetical protein
MIPRPRGLFSHQGDWRTLLGGSLGIVILVVVERYVLQPLSLLGDEVLMRVANAAAIAAVCLLIGAAVGLLPREFWKPALQVAGFLDVVMVVGTMPFHEADTYRAGIQLLLSLPPMIVGALMSDRFKPTRRRSAAGQGAVRPSI